MDGRLFAFCAPDSTFWNCKFYYTFRHFMALQNIVSLFVLLSWHDREFIRLRVIVHDHFSEICMLSDLSEEDGKSASMYFLSAAIFLFCTQLIKNTSRLNEIHECKLRKFLLTGNFLKEHFAILFGYNNKIILS